MCGTGLVLSVRPKKLYGPRGTSRADGAIVVDGAVVVPGVGLDSVLDVGLVAASTVDVVPPKLGLLGFGCDGGRGVGSACSFEKD